MLPFISHEVPGIGGTLKTVAEDFHVTEIPSYEPTGEGEHYLLEVTKKDITTRAVITELAQKLNVPSGEIGSAGMKDRNAVTTQRISVPCTADVSNLDGLDLTFSAKVLGKHCNKLRTGHLSGNHFTIRVRNANPQWQSMVKDTESLLKSVGFANFFGSQRFGKYSDNASIGENAVRSGKIFGPKWRKWLMISAFQSHLFNTYLTLRIKDGLFTKALKGDIFGKLPKGGVFLSQDPEAEQPRMDSFEISPMGPIYGYKLMQTKDEALEREMAVLNATACVKQTSSGEKELPAICLEDFRKVKAQGSRRRFRLQLENFSISSVEGDPLFDFDLPSGCYATVLMNEFMKIEAESLPEETAEEE